MEIHGPQVGKRGPFVISIGKRGPFVISIGERGPFVISQPAPARRNPTGAGEAPSRRFAPAKSCIGQKHGQTEVRTNRNTDDDKYEVGGMPSGQQN